MRGRSTMAPREALSLAFQDCCSHTTRGSCSDARNTNARGNRASQPGPVATKRVRERSAAERPREQRTAVRIPGSDSGMQGRSASTRRPLRQCQLRTDRSVIRCASLPDRIHSYGGSVAGDVCHTRVVGSILGTSSQSVTATRTDPTAS